jgi:hypothetical protein
MLILSKGMKVKRMSYGRDVQAQLCIYLRHQKQPQQLYDSLSADAYLYTSQLGQLYSSAVLIRLSRMIRTDLSSSQAMRVTSPGHPPGHQRERYVFQTPSAASDEEIFGIVGGVHVPFSTRIGIQLFIPAIP